jgi:hypothetical protein
MEQSILPSRQETASRPLALAGDSTSDLYVGLWVAPLIRVHDTGAANTSFKADFDARAGEIAVAQDGSGDVLISAIIKDPFGI